MKYYDYARAKKLIEENQFNLESASLGMYEDWWWTAKTIYEDGKYKKLEFKVPDCFNNREERERNKQQEVPFIAGIQGSCWATPALELEFKDGTTRMIPCYQGESSGEKPIGFMLGALSSPAQDDVPELETV